MLKHAIRILTTLALLPLINANVFALDTTEQDYELKLLGKYIFFDKISNPGRMSCATCHDPATGGTGSVSGVNLHQVAITGANPHTAGNLKPPTNAYASFIAAFDFCDPPGPASNAPCGGNFWNGRAEGRGSDVGGAIFPAAAAQHIGTEVFQGSTDDAILAYAKYFGPTSDQALNPMPNPGEQNIDRQSVCQHVSAAKYSTLYKRVWSEAIDCSDKPVSIKAEDVASETEFDISFKRLMLAVGAWQHSSELNSFSSRRDIALTEELDCLAGKASAKPEICSHPDYINSPGEFPLVSLTDQENIGHDLFYNVGKRTNCLFCHRSDNRSGTTLTERYTDDVYHNIGTPANPEIPGNPGPAEGLASHTGDASHMGEHKTPTLRNVDKRKGNGFIKAYTHNGWFKSLESLVHFYNTADVNGETAKSYGVTRCPGNIKTEKDALKANCWPAPEVEQNSAVGGILGDLSLSLEEEAALVAYMKTFTDTVTPRQPEPYNSAKK